MALQHQHYSIIGVVVTSTLVALWITGVISVNPFLMAIIVGLVGGCLLRTWWSLLATPLIAFGTIAGLALIGGRGTAPDNGEMSLAGAIVLGLFLLALVSWSAAIGTGIAETLRRGDE